MPLPVPLPLITLLADAAPAGDPASYQSAGWILLALAGLAAAGNQLLGFVEKIRSLRAPEPGAISPERIKALEDRVHGVELRIENHMGAINSKMDGFTSSLTRIVSDFNYAIGRIDGRTENTPPQN